VGFQEICVCPDHDFFFLLSGDLQISDSFQADQFVPYIILRNFAQLIHIVYVGMGETNEHNRCCIGIVLGHSQFIDSRILTETGQSLLQIQERLIHICIPCIFYSNLSNTHFGYGGNLDHFFLTDCLGFDGIDKPGFNLFRRPFSGFQFHKDSWIVQIREKIDAELLKGNVPQKQHRKNQHQDSNGIVH